MKQTYPQMPVCLLFYLVISLFGGGLLAPSIAQSSEPLFTLTEEEKAWVKANPAITVSNEFDWPPFDFVVSGQPAGFGIDLMNLLSERSGIVFDYINGYSWDELVSMFFAGEIDLLHSLSSTPERAEKAFFSPPYYHSKNVLILRSDALDTHDLKDLEGKIIALPKGWSSIEFFEKFYPKVHIIEVESSRQALEYVDQGKVFATVEQEGIGAYFIKKFGFHDLKLSKWIENEELQKTSSMHFAVLKNRPLLSTILNKALNTLQPDDMIKLEQKWFSRGGRQIGIEDVGLIPGERAFLETKSTITYCVAPDNMPFEAYQFNQVTGMTADFLEMFSERLGISFTLVPTDSWTESLEKIKGGECDILPMVNETQDRKEYIDFTSSYLNYGVAIISREREPFIGGLKGLEKRKVAVPSGVFIEDWITRQYPQIILVPFAGAQQCLLGLSAGEVDAALLSLPVATYQIRQMGLNDLKVAGYTQLQDTIRIGVRKNDIQLHSIMSKLVRELPLKDIDSVYRKWVFLTFEHKFNYTLFWKVLGVIGILLIMVIAWNRQLMRLNKKLALAHKELAVASEELKRISITDVLTTLYNRGHVENKLNEEMSRHIRYKRDLSVIMVDLDYFKQINDTHGHHEGDRVLRDFSAMVKSNIRDSDIPGRWGGEEFLIICPESDLDGAVFLAENLRDKTSQIPFPVTGPQSASFGVATFTPGESRDELVRRADEALYLAKRNGRNCVETAS